MNRQETNTYWSNPDNRKLEASKYMSRNEFRKKKRTVYERCTYSELELYFGKTENDREHKVKCDFGMPDYYRYYKETSDDAVSKSLFNEVLRDYLKINHGILCNTAQPFVLPERTGKVVVRKFKREMTIEKDGSIKNNFPINWKATKALWAENEEAKENKTLLRHTNEHTDGHYFLIVYMKGTAKFRGKSYYKMQINRQMQRSLFEPIMNGEIDAFLLVNKRKRN